MKTLRDLALALLNATLMLAIILAICLTLLLREVNDLKNLSAVMVGEALQPHAQSLTRIADGVEALEARLEGASDLRLRKIHEEIIGLRQDLPNLPAGQDLSLRAFASQLLSEIARQLQADA